MQALLHVDELLHLALEQTGDGDLRPGRDHGGDVVLVDLLLHHRLDGADGLAALGQLLLEGGQEPVADLRHTLEVAVALGPLGLHAQLVDLPRDLLDAVEHILLAGPARSELVTTGLGLGDLALHGLAHGRRLLRHRGELDLELRHAPLGLVEFDRRAVDLHPEPGGRLVDEVDRLVRQEAVGDVALGENSGRGQRRIADPHAVMRLVALLEAAQDRDRVGHGRLTDEHRLEAPLERRVLLDVLAVLVEGRRADRTQLAARQHRLEQVSGRDGALGGTGADDRVELVDEEDDLALRRGDLRKHGLEPLLELAPVLGAGDQRPDVERPDALSLQSLRHVARDNALGQALGDRRLADPWLADQHRIVLRAAREHLDRAPDLLVAADHRVELAGLGGSGEITAEPRQCLVSPLGILRRHALPAAHILQRTEERLAGHELERQDEVLDRDELVIELARLVERIVECLAERPASLWGGVRTADGRQRP